MEKGGNGRRAGSGPAKPTGSSVPPIRVLAGCRDVPPMTPSSGTGFAIEPATAHETRPITSAATASRRNATAGPIE
jgi:hypothetical protein